MADNDRAPPPKDAIDPSDIFSHQPHEWSDEVEPDALHKFIYWERKHLNPYEIEEFLRDRLGWLPPIEKLK